jgi:hypothetical protein
MWHPPGIRFGTNQLERGVAFKDATEHEHRQYSLGALDKDSVLM